MLFHVPALRRKLATANPLLFTLIAGIVAFLAYGCVYAFRKPFTAATFSGLEVWGIQYKIALVIAQVAGYSLSKFIGIRVISSLQPKRRAITLLLMMSIAALSLLGFAFSSLYWGVFWLFINGIPLGMAWGVVFSYLEGRRVTEALAAMLCINFILTSGFVKTLGRTLILTHHVSEFWMPFIIGIAFFPILLLCIWLLEHLPPPSIDDQAARVERIVMTDSDRNKLFRRYAVGLILMVAIYLILTIIRDIRDNFIVEIWTELGLGKETSLLTTAEIPIALFVLLVVASLTLIKNNFKALWMYHAIIMAGALLIIGATLLFQAQIISPIFWMILSGSGAILPYILFNGVLFDRLLAAFSEKGNVGFLMYIADAFGYLGSVAVLLWRNFGHHDRSWVRFFSDLCLSGATIIIILSTLSWIYYKRKSTLSNNP